MLGFLKTLIQPLVSMVLIPWLKQKVVVTKGDQARFDLIQALAGEAADLIVLRDPDDDTSLMIQRVIEEVGNAFPTSNNRVVYRAAAVAVRRALEAYRTS